MLTQHERARPSPWDRKLLFLVGAWVDPSINPGLYQLPKEQKAAIRVRELQAVNDPLSRHGHHKPGKSGRPANHPTSPFDDAVSNDAFGANLVIRRGGT
jgi:hypothetical protein